MTTASTFREPAEEAIVNNIDATPLKCYLWFHEFFHGDNGRGVGATHQTGWTGLVAKLLQPRVD
jgi:hypothetical protein